MDDEHGDEPRYSSFGTLGVGSVVDDETSRTELLTYISYAPELCTEDLADTVDTVDTVDAGTNSSEWGLSLATDWPPNPHPLFALKNENEELKDENERLRNENARLEAELLGLRRSDHLFRPSSPAALTSSSYHSPWLVNDRNQSTEPITLAYTTADSFNMDTDLNCIDDVDTSGIESDFNAQAGSSAAGTPSATIGPIEDSTRKRHPRADEGYSCSGCEKRFALVRDLRRHQKTHSERNERIHKCSECVASFNDQKDLRRHVQSKHAASTMFTCPQCGLSSARRDNMNRHMRNKHGLEYGAFDVGVG